MTSSTALDGLDAGQSIAAQCYWKAMGASLMCQKPALRCPSWHFCPDCFTGTGVQLPEDGEEGKQVTALDSLEETPMPSKDTDRLLDTF